MNVVRCQMKNIMKSGNVNQEKLHPFPHIHLGKMMTKQWKVERGKEGGG